MKCKKQKTQSSEVNNNAFTVLLPRGGQAGGEVNRAGLHIY